jgi:ribosomal protein S24E
MTENNAVGSRDVMNTVIGRRELDLALTVSASEPTPSRGKVKGQLSASLGVGPDQVVVRRITHRYGSSVVDVRVHVYNTKELAATYEPKYLFDRDAGKKATRKEQAETPIQPAKAEAAKE